MHAVSTDSQGHSFFLFSFLVRMTQESSYSKNMHTTRTRERWYLTRVWDLLWYQLAAYKRLKVRHVYFLTLWFPNCSAMAASQISTRQTYGDLLRFLVRHLCLDLTFYSLHKNSWIQTLSQCSFQFTVSEKAMPT